MFRNQTSFSDINVINDISIISVLMKTIISWYQTSISRYADMVYWLKHFVGFSLKMHLIENLGLISTCATGSFISLNTCDYSETTCDSANCWLQIFYVHSIFLCRCSGSLNITNWKISRLGFAYSCAQAHFASKNSFQKCYLPFRAHTSQVHQLCSRVI